MDHVDLNQLRSVEELLAQKRELEARMTELDTEFAGSPFTEEAREEFGYLDETSKEIEARVMELRARAERISRIAATDENRESGFEFQTRRPGATRNEDIYDLTTVRSSFTEPHLAAAELSDRAKRSIDMSSFPADRNTTQEDLRERVSGLLDQHNEDGEIARRILLTGSPAYKRAFRKYLAGAPRTREEDDSLSRAASLTTTAGGFAVPYTLDPTVILTNNGAINPVRGLARVVTITGNDWRGVSSAGITASYDAEATEVSDDTPTLAQPTANVEMARAFVPMSIEISEDWGSIQAEMARMFSDAKDILENTKFLTGLGHTSNEPEGLLVGATGTVHSATSSVFAIADLYTLENALAPRWRSRASIVANKAAYQKVRQFDTGGGASLWVQLRFGDPGDLLGYPAYEWSAYSSAVTTPGASIMTIGDFNQFLIVDRVGMGVEVIPHMFSTANNLPSGQRGLFAYWRNTSDVTVAGAFKTLKLT